MTTIVRSYLRRTFAVRTTTELIAERLARFQGVRDAFLGFSFAAEADERFALQIEEVLLGDSLRRRDRAAGQNIGKLPRDQAVEFGGELATHHAVNREPRKRVKFLAEYANFRRRRGMIAGANHGQRRLFRIGDLAVAIHGN